ncbi:hypothetical protein PQO01_18270 [Lentisphaera marina]|uniref:hypothetical protein n=1 Tax=Lentisphaera marina TaxID=1111041 RepID=UPI002366EA62|nr:hypothetical protein [Lentisphaera marina]MDD7986898.1 hypothetical protein [Lentisphaera marina]
MIKETDHQSFVICDDDTFYPRTWFANLIDPIKESPVNEVIAHRCHRMILKNNKLLPYNSWEQNLTGSNSSAKDLFPTGCGGVYIPREIFSEDFINLELILKLCPRADDIWLKFAALYAGIKTRKTAYDFIPIEEVSTEVSSLMNSNILENENDKQLKELVNHFETPLAELLQIN